MIKPGDMVMVVSGHSCALGEIYVVDGIEGGCGVHVELTCACGWQEVVDEACAWDGDDDGSCPTRWLIKIDPGPEVIAELETAEA